MAATDTARGDVCAVAGAGARCVQLQFRVGTPPPAHHDSGKKERSQITIHWTILEDRYKRLVKTDKIHFFFISLGTE